MGAIEGRPSAGTGTVVRESIAVGGPAPPDPIARNRVEAADVTILRRAPTRIPTGGHDATSLR